jgi:hypothetical protein
MVIPMILGYVVGAVAMYTILHRTAPVLADESGTHPVAEFDTQIIELFPAKEERKAA